MAFVEVPALDLDAADAPTSKTWHKFAIQVNNQIVGRISNFTPNTDTRGVKQVRELGLESYGRVVETVPTKNDDGDYKITIKRTEVWNNEMELAFGFAARFTDLMDQTRPFTVLAQLYKGDIQYSETAYTGCWFTSKGEEERSADGEAIIVVNADITFTSKQIVHQG